MKAQEAEEIEFKLKEAAEFLTKETGKNFSTRTFERLHLEHLFKKTITATVPVRFWKKSTLEQYAENLKNELQKETHIPGIMKFEPQQQITGEQFIEFANILVSGIDAKFKQLAPAPTETPKKVVKIADFKDKLILNFGQALAYSGLTKEDLIHALESKSVFGKKTSEKGVWKINRQSLDEFCKHFGS